MRFALLFLLAGPALAQPGALEADRPYARIYAPTAADLEAAIEEVSFAALQFERAFGEPPPPIRVVVADGPAALAGLEPDPDGRATLPFWTRRGLTSRPPDVVMAAGALLRDVGGALRVVGVLRDAGPLQTGDEVAAVVGQAVASLAEWRRAFAGLEDGAPAEVTVRRGGEPVTVAVEAEAAPSVARLSAASAAARPLSHEAGHLFLTSYARQRGSGPFVRDTSRVYSGVPALPDWLDEAFAVWCEVPAAVRERDAALARRAGDVIPLDSLLAMDHPLVASGALDSLDLEDGPVRLAVGARTARALQGSGLFYAQSGSLLRYLVATRGERVVGRLVDRVLEGATIEAALEAENVDPAALEDGWAAWVRATA